MQSIQTLTLIGKVLIRCVLHNISLKFKTVCFLQTKNCFVLAWLIRRPVFSAKQRLNPQGIYSFPVEYHLVFGNMSCPGCAIITSLLIALKRKMSFLLSSILQNIFSCLTIFCFWVSFIFTLGNTRMAYLLFKVLQPGQGVFTISNSILPGKETNQTIILESGKSY